MPTATKLKALGQHEGLRDLLLKWSKIAFSLSLVASIYLAVFGPRFLSVWIGPHFELEGGNVLRVLIISTVVFLPMRGIALPILMGLGKPKGAVWGLLGTGLLNLVLSILWVRPYGLVGVAWGTTIPNLVYSALLLWLVCDELGCSIWDYVRYVAVRAVLGCGIVYPLVYLMERNLPLRGYPMLISGGFWTLFAFGSVWLMFVYRRDPYFNPQEKFSRFLPARLRDANPY
jgi:O-antigen/teichoic acid export membrane protein